MKNAPFSHQIVESSYQQGELPTTEILPCAPPTNCSVRAELISTGTPRLSIKALTRSTVNPVENSSTASRCEPESFNCPPPLRAGSCRHVPWQPFIQPCPCKPCTNCTLPKRPLAMVSRMYRNSGW